MNIREQPLVTFGDLLKQLGNVPPSRVRLRPTPGTATEKDVVAVHDREKRLCELVDGVLVEKPMGYGESRLALLLAVYLQTFVEQHDLGIVAGEGGMLKLDKGLVRIPDVSFISWQRLPNPKALQQTVPELAPDLAVEVLSRSNTRGEMNRKLREYFLAGTALVWLVQPKDRTIRVHTAPDAFVLLKEGDTLEGGTVLPGFSLSVRELFARAERHGPGKASR